LLVGLIVGML